MVVRGIGGWQQLDQPNGPHCSPQQHQHQHQHQRHQHRHRQQGPPQLLRQPHPHPHPHPQQQLQPRGLLQIQQHHQHHHEIQHELRHLCDGQNVQRLSLPRVCPEDAGGSGGADDIPELLLQPQPVSVAMPGQLPLCPGQRQEQQPALPLRHGQPLLQAAGHAASFVPGYYGSAAAYDGPALLGETAVPQPLLDTLLADQAASSPDGGSRQAAELRHPEHQGRAAVPEPLPGPEPPEEPPRAVGDPQYPGSPSNVAGPPAASAPAAGADAGTGAETAAGPASVPEFVKKLYRMLEDPTCSDAVLWAKGRDKFVIRDPNVFAKHVLPRHFKHNNFASFVRQLNKYDFHKAKVDPEDARALGENACSFSHTNFHADKTDLLVRIKRKAPNRGWGKAGLVCVVDPAGCSRNAMDQATDTGATSSLISLNARLQQQVEDVMRQQSQLAKTVELLSRNYNFVVKELTRSKDLLAAQDEVLRMARCVFANASADIRPALSTETWQMLRPGLTTALHQSRRCSPELNFQQASEATIDDYGAAGAAARFTAVSFPPVDGPPTSTSDPGGGAGDRGLSLGGVLRYVGGGAFDDASTQPNTPLPGTSFEGVGEPASASAVACLWSNAEKQPRPMRVLVVDDDSAQRQISGRLLKVFGCTCDVATDGIGAVDMMECAKYDIVLMDISMPNLDGISATTRIRQFDRTTPIICVTSSASAQERVIYLTNGMNDVLAKPMSTQGLRSVLAKFCREPLRSGAAPFKVIEDSDCTEGGAAAAALKVIIEEGTEGAGAGAATGEVRKRRPDAAKRPGYQRQTQPAQPVSPLNAEASSPPSTTVSSAAYNVGPTGYPQDLPAGAWEFFGPDSGALSYAAAATAAAAAQQQQQQQRGRHGQWQRQRQHQPQSAQWGLGPAAGGDPPQQQQLPPPPASSPGTLLPPAAAPPAPFSASFAEADHRAKRPKFS